MCISPSFFWLDRGTEWEQIPKACGHCWRCKQNRVNAYVGRAMAETSVSASVCTLSLTYAPRLDLADKVLNPVHFQMFIKQLRNSGHLVRYLVAGEYGDLKGRSHFHAMLFFTHIEPSKTGEVPSWNPAHMFDYKQSAPFSDQLPQKRMCHIREWPHGHVKGDWTASEQAARYVCKYLLADDKNNAWFSLSKKPALGAAWFAQKAELSKSYGVLPSSFEYQPPNSSKARPYLLTGATRRDYLNAITTDPKDREKMSEWVQKTFDKLSLDRFRARLAESSPEEIDAAYSALYERKTELQALKMAQDNRAYLDYLDRVISAQNLFIQRKKHG